MPDLNRSTEPKTIEACIARNIKRRRLSLEMTRDQLGELIHSDKYHVKRLELGEAKVTLEEAARLAKALKLNNPMLFLERDLMERIPST